MTTHPLMTGSTSRSTEGHQTHPLDEDCSYLANLFGPSQEEELVTLARSI